MALALLLQSAGASVLDLGTPRQGHGAAAEAAAAPTLFLAAICGPDGLRQQAPEPDADTAPDPSSPRRHGAWGACCIACHALPQPPGLPAPGGAALPGAAFRPAQSVAWMPNPAEAPPPPPRGSLRPGAPRAPPPLLS